MFAELTCHKCHAVGESKFTISGPHIKQSCSVCGAYIKFIHQRELPSLKDVRAAIWQKVEGDEAVIDQLKDESNFIYYKSDPDRFVQYWKLWLKICSEQK